MKEEKKNRSERRAVEARDNRDNYRRDPASGMIESTKADFKLSRT
jgi:hypothetical protein